MVAGARTVIICLPSGPSWWTILPALITPIIGCLALYFAWQNIRNARDLARNKATLDLIEKKESTEHYRAINDIFSTLRLGKGFTHLNDPQTDPERKERQAVIDYLNHYEMVAIGIRDELLDAQLYRAWMEGAFVRDWNAAAQWVQRERWKYEKDRGWTYRASILQNYQDAACQWSQEAIRLNDTTSGPPVEPAGTSDEALPRPIDDVTLGKDVKRD